MKFNEIIEKLGDAAVCNSLKLNPNFNPEITGVAPVDEAYAGSISYIDGGKFSAFVSKTAASVLILPQVEELQAQAHSRGIAWISVANPRLLFAQAIALFYQPYKPSSGIHPTAVIHPEAEIGKDVSIGARVVIQAGAKIGNNVCLHPHVVIYPQVEIGDRTILHANCTIHERVRIGADCVIHSGAVIGAEGFGFVPTPKGWYKMEQSGCTVLEDGVEIGCRSTVDRPAVGETRIGRNSKLDNQVHIGHNGHIGSNCVLVGQVGLAGGVTVGNNVMLAGQSGIANRARVGDSAIATARAGIHNDIAPKALVSGSPAMPHPVFLKISVILSRLPEIYYGLRQFNKQHKL